MSLTKLSQAGNHLFILVERESGWLMTSRLGTGKSLNIFTVQNKIPPLKVHKNENYFDFDFEFCIVSLLGLLKYEGFVKENC
jgi:hypothetical protein